MDEFQFQFCQTKGTHISAHLHDKMLCSAMQVVRLFACDKSTMR